MFAGCGNLSRHMERRGLGRVRIDIRNNSMPDLRNPIVFSTLKGWVQGGLVAAI